MMPRPLRLEYYILKNLLFGVKYPFGMSIDVTNRCNLNCKHCYFQKQGYKNELGKEELLKKIRETKEKYPNIIHASWVGGEPLLRKDVVFEGMKMFPFNMIVTNGTIELPKWKNCVFNVSVDGTKKYYEKIRGTNKYDIVKQNADRKDIKVNAVCVLSRKNYHCIEEMLHEWSKTSVGGIAFDFFTPIKGIEEGYWLDWKERDKIIENLLELKKDYGNFLLTPEPVLEMMRSENSKSVTKQCIVTKADVCLDPMGNRKLPCVIGEKADCSRCGCIIPFFLESLIVKKQLKTLYAAKRGFT